MGIAIDTFGQYAGKAYEGQINDLSMADVTTVVGAVAIPFARAVVSAVADKQGQLPAAAAGFFLGISVRKTVGVSSSYVTGQANDSGNQVGAYRANEEVSVLSTGRIWVKTLDGATKGAQVYAVPLTGELTNKATAGYHLLPGCVFKTTAAAGELALVQVKSDATTTIASA
ncbi:MAG: structural cement protein Gp24 [Pseudomonas helleri]|uniref:structural cement protein Gp24 n=1 Tax=Pseudomonas helleri TaxID=1608996 RepID=UPI003FD627F6